MPASSKLTKQTNARLPVDLIEWMATQPGSQAEVIVQALTALRDGALANDDAEAKLAAMTTERDQWRQRAQAIVSAATPAKRTKQISAHPAGPVFEPKLSVAGTAQPIFKKSMKTAV